MEYVQFPTDQQIYDAGLSRAGYYRKFAEQQRLKREFDRIAANTVSGVTRSGSRFYEGGTPFTKLKAWQGQQAQQVSVEAETEEKARITYCEFVAFQGFETAQGREAAARLATLMGYNRLTVPRDFGTWIRGDEARQRFMQK